MPIYTSPPDPDMTPEEIDTSHRNVELFRRALWQRKAYWIATWARWIAILVLVPDIFIIIEYHFPFWADLVLPITFAAHQIAAFVQRRTQMYAGDIL